jgi:excisionase family DNA binding protein
MPALLSTGKVAQLCSVKPDTVLKWIKKGRVSATRTAGGHYRVDEAAVAAILSHSESTAAKVAEPLGIAHPLRCWEYMGSTLSERCKACVVYRTHATWCFELVKVLRGSGHEKVLCPGSCQECPYYRRAHHLPTNVLVITRDETLIQHLAKRNNGCVAFRYARTGYDASAIISVFRPALVVLDPIVANGGLVELAEALAADERAPGVRILVAVRDGDGQPELQSPAIAGTIPIPFCCNDISEFVEQYPVEALPEEQ